MTATIIPATAGWTVCIADPAIPYQLIQYSVIRWLWSDGSTKPAPVLAWGTELPPIHALRDPNDNFYIRGLPPRSYSEHSIVEILTPPKVGADPNNDQVAADPNNDQVQR
jgi:hypothetical protein